AQGDLRQRDEEPSVNRRMSADAFLLRLHLVRSVVPTVLVTLTIYTVLYIISRIAQRAQHLDPKSVDELLDVICVFTIMFMALPIGAVTFTRPVKEQNIIFLHSLPVSRGRQW